MSLKIMSNKEEELPILKKRFGVRHIQIFLMFLGLVFSYFLRVNMSIAIVAMTDNNVNPHITHFNWDSKIRSLILSSFFWGYVLAQLPAGLLAKRFGAKIILLIASGLCSIITIFIPIASNNGGWKLVCFLRIIIGLCQGVVYPCVHSLLSHWVPSTERGFFSSFVYSGGSLGTVIILATSGIMIESTSGWPSLFYFSATITIIWCIFYCIFGSNTPNECKGITKIELDYIEKLTGATFVKFPVPWKSIFTSIPFIALTFAHIGFTWGFYTLLTEIPTYLNKALSMDVQSNALVSALPYLAMWILSLLISPIADALINHKIITVEVSRKIFNTIGFCIPMASLIALSYMTKNDRTMAIVLLTLAVGTNSASYVGYMVNHMDLSPNYAGTLMGITNGISNLSSIFAPIVVGALVENENNSSDWRVVFFITGGVYFFCSVIFVIFGKASIQPWNEPNIKPKIDNGIEIISRTDIRKNNIKSIQ